MGPPGRLIAGAGCHREKAGERQRRSGSRARTERARVKIMMQTRRVSREENIDESHVLNVKIVNLALVDGWLVRGFVSVGANVSRRT